jgi:dihydrofolate reductase
MRKLLLKMSVTVDGFCGGPNGEIDWIFSSMSDEGAAWTVGVISKAGLHIMGSRTFHDMAQYWPTSTEVFAAPMNDIPKAVFTRKGITSVGDPTQSTTALKQSNEIFKDRPRTATPAMKSWQEALILTGDLREEILKLKSQPGKDIVAHGGASFAQSLVATGLIDEYHLLVHPVVLGKGLPAFTGLKERVGLELMEVKAFPRGAVAHSYRVK